MILHPGILSLLIGSTLSLAMVLYAAVTGVVILCRWDFRSSSAYQLTLERRTYLVSTLVNTALALQIGSVILFIYTVEDIHQLFVGAMCATGSLNANPVGWYALLSKIAVFFLSGFWIALNYLDHNSEEYPLIRLKYLMLMAIVPCIGADLYLQFRYFLGLHPDIITSCCGSLFGSTSDAAVGSLAGLPAIPTMVLFYAWAAIVVGSGFLALHRRSGWLTVFSAAATAIFFLLAIVSIISFVSIYIYELPTHHCPFDILQREYGFIGYPLYLLLFTGTFFGILPGLFHPLKKLYGLTEVIHSVDGKWSRWSLVSLSGFVALVTWAICSSNLDLLG